jgi:tritrans,polycis-undecaprenyl-diphosphate synthase [geranylgeranyl-diphosphate specific]
MLEGFLRAVGAYAVYERWLEGQVRKQPVPEHLGVILDGNRRWAIARSGIAFEGHHYGAKTSELFLEWCLDLNIKTITLYVFSMENFNRSKQEVDTIFGIIEEEARRLLKDQRLHDSQVRVKALGRLDLLPERLQKLLQEIEHATEAYEKHYLNIAQT